MATVGSAPAHPAIAQAPRDDLDALQALVGRPVDAAERIGAGRNSRVYRVSAGGAEYAAKFYFKPTADGRDRLQVEYTALQFLWERGVRTIAQPVCADAARQVALYGFVRGEAVQAAGVSGADVDQLVAFVETLNRIGTDTNSTMLGTAAEAFFTAAGVVSNLRQRLAQLQAIDAQGNTYDALRRFLREQFAPALENLGRGATAGAAQELERKYRTLSPSDLGFHNALREPLGGLVFLDFEYFGWDDPAKTLSDCMLHPMMRLGPEPRQQLAAGFDRVFGTDPGWRGRVAALYPLFALKWCMIMLNEFRVDQIERRRYVDRNAEEIGVIQMRQLDAAQALLERTVRERGEFPYWEQGK